MDFKRHNVKTVRLNTGLKAPGNLRQLMEDDFVKEMAESIEQFGLLHPPTVNKATKDIIAGRNRVAAHFLLKRDTIDVSYVEIEDLHAKALEIVENLHRRHDPKMQERLQHDLVRVFEEEEKAKDATGVEEPRTEGNTRGPKASPRRRAIKRTAAAAGKSVATVQRAVQRAEKKKSEARSARNAISEDPPVVTFGLEVDPAFLGKLSSIQSVCDTAYAGLLEAQRRMTRLVSNESPIHKHTSQSLRPAYASLASETKAERPISICPGCKLIETVLPTCMICLGSGYVTERQWKTIPRELKSKECLVVQVNAHIGEATFVSYDDMFDYEDDEQEPETPEVTDDADLSGLFTLE